MTNRYEAPPAVLAVLLALVAATAWPRGARSRDRPGGEPAGRDRGRVGIRPLALDPNRSPARHLVLLPRIGPVRARSIVEERNRTGPYGSPDELARVHGIGPVTVGAVRPLLGMAADAGGRPAAAGGPIRAADP